jgi:hypothetical protein
MDWSMVTVMGVPAGIELAAWVTVAREKQKAISDTEKRMREFISVTSE